jgi:hypothetical protein
LTFRICVLSIDGPEELDRLVAVRELFADMRLILVLADNHPDTLAKAHRLAPRFITFSDANPLSLLSVLEKMTAS